MSQILAVLGVNPSEHYFHDRMNLYHSGDDFPFAVFFKKDNCMCIRVGSGEKFERASFVNLGKYAKY